MQNTDDTKSYNRSKSTHFTELNGDLNQLHGGLKPVGIGTVFLADAVTMGNGYLNLNSFRFIGKGLKNESGGIKILENVSRIIITGQVFTYRTPETHYDWWQIEQSKNKVSVSISATSVGYTTTVFSPVVCNTKAGDLIQLSHLMEEKDWQVRADYNTYLTVTAYE